MAADPEIPDPNEAAAVSSAGADDMLAKLAGDEIDRLLAEAETAPLPVAPPTPAATTEASEPQPVEGPLAVVPPAPEETAPPPPATANEPDPAPPVVAKDTAAPAAPEGLDSATMQSEVDALLNQASLPETATPANPAPATTEPALSAAAAEIAAELDQAEAAAKTALTEPHDDEPEETAEPYIKFVRTQAWVKPLEWLTIPIIPDPIRDLLGKVAIVTLINAAGLLALAWYWKK